MADRAPVFLWQSDREGRLTWANTALQRYAGVALDGTATLDSLVHPEDRPAARVAWARPDASRQGASSQGASDEGVAGRFWLLGRDGDCRWFLVGARPMSAPDGAEIGWCGSAVDVGDGVSLSAAEEEGSLVEAVRSASSGLLWILDADRGVVQGLNPEFASGWSLPANGAPAPWTDWLDALHPEDRPKVAAAMDEVLKGATRQGRIRFGAGEAMRCFHATAFPIAGAVRRVGGYLVDVTLPPTRRLYVLDGETASRERWGQIFSQAGFKVRSFPDLEAAMRLIPDLQPGVFILAGREDPGAIEQAAGALGLRARKIPWIAVGDFGEVATVVRLMRAGAAHVARENDPAWALIDAVQAAAPLIAGSRGDAADAARRLAGLTARERQVLDGLLAGGSNKSIAQTLGLSPRTVETYRGSLMDRLGARTLADLLRITAAGRGAGRDRRPD